MTKLEKMHKEKEEPLDEEILIDKEKIKDILERMKNVLENEE